MRCSIARCSTTKAGEEHYNLISALHKSLRGSDPDAALYWLGRMLEAGEDPLYVVRRLIRFASEDVGMADPQALMVCVGGAADGSLRRHARGRAGAGAGRRPSGDRAQEQRALYRLQRRAGGCARDPQRSGAAAHLRNAPTGLMKELDYGKGYELRARHTMRGQPDPEDPSRPPPERPQDYLPEQMRDRQYYHPTAQGGEASIAAWLRRRRKQ